MAIEFTCPACGGALRVRDAAAGRVVRCGGCLTTLRAPDASPPPAPAPEPRTRPAPPAEFSPPDDSPERPVRGTRFGLMVTAATVGLGACGCCGLAAVVLPGPEWREYESERGGFRVELPADPGDLDEEFPQRQGKTVEGAKLWTRAEYYTVTYLDRAAAGRKPDAQVLDDFLRDLAANPKVRRVSRDEEVEVGGFPGREFEYEGRRGGTYTGRVVVTGSRVYVVLAGGRFTRPGDENVRYFLDSFEFTDPAVVAEGGRRSRDDLRAAGAAAAAAALEAARD